MMICMGKLHYYRSHKKLIKMTIDKFTYDLYTYACCWL